MSVTAISATTPAGKPGSVASPTSTSSLVPPALNSTLSSCTCYIVNGTDSTKSTLSSPGVPRSSQSPTNASLSSTWLGQTNATTALSNSTLSCVQPPATPTATPSTSLTPTSSSSSTTSPHTLNTSKTKLTKTSTTSSPHPSIPPDSSGVPVISSSPPSTPERSLTHETPSLSASSRNSSGSVVVVPSPPSPPASVPAHTSTQPFPSPPSTPERSLTHETSPSLSASSRTSSRSAVVNPSPPSPPASVPAHTTTRPSESSPTPPEVPNLPSIVPPVRPAVPSNASVTVSKGPTPSPAPVAQSSPASVTKFPTSSGTRWTTTLTETPESTFSTPVSITETTNSHVTITAPPLITTTGLSTLPDGTPVTVTHVVANPPTQDIFGSSNGDSFFRNHAAVVGVFLASGVALAGLLLLAFCCFRRQQRRAQRWPPEISHPRPVQNPFADVTGNPEMREGAGPSIRWRGFMFPRGGASTSQSLFSLPIHRSEDSLPAEHSAPVPPLPAQRAASRSSYRSSYRVPVPYADVGNDSRVENLRSTGASGGEHIIQIAQPSNVPPQLPMRSPLRLLAAQNIAKITRENALELSLSRVSSRSVYSPSLHRPDAESLYQEKEVVARSPPSSSLIRVPSGWLTRGLSYGTKFDRVDGNAESQGAQISPVDSEGTPSLAVSASSSSHAHYSPLESPASETSTAFTSMHDGISHNRKVALPRTPPAALLTHRKSGARLPQAS